MNVISIKILTIYNWLELQVVVQGRHGEVSLYAIHTCVCNISNNRFIREGDHLSGNIMRQGDQVRFDLMSSLPLKAFKPFIKADGPLEEALSHVTFSENSTIALDVIGTLYLGDRTDWSATGTVLLNDLTYEGTRFHHLATSYQIAPDKAEFFDIEGLLNDDQESIRRRYKSAASDPI